MQPLSTDKTILDTNQKTIRIIGSGDFTISGFTATTGGYSAGAAVLLPNSPDKFTNYFSIRMWHFVSQGSGVYDRRFMNYVYSTGTAITRNANFYTSTALVNGTESVTYLWANYFSSSISAAERDSAYYTQSFYYEIYSEVIPSI